MRGIDEIVAVNIQVKMTDLNLNQKTLAKLVGITPAYLNKLLVGKKPISKSHKLKEIAEKLGCQEADLYQDPKYVNDLAVTRTVSANHEARLKEMNRMLGEQLGEALGELKEARTLLAGCTLSADENKLLATFRSAPLARRKSILDFAALVPAPKKAKVTRRRS